MPSIDRLLVRAITFINEGRQADARPLLQAVIQQEPHNQQAWDWYVGSFREIDQRIKAFDEYLAVFPEDQNSREVQSTLLKEANQRWRQRVVDAVDEAVWVKQESEREMKARGRAALRIKLVLGSLCLILVGALYIASAGASARIKKVKDEVNSLTLTYEGLDLAYQTLGRQHDDLVSDHNNLTAEYTLLIEDYNLVVDEYTALYNQHADLEAEYDWLEGVAVTPPYILTNGRNVKLAFEKLDGTLMYWDVPFESLENDLERGNNLRDEIARVPWDYSLSLKVSGTDESISVVDVRPFVDSWYFSNIIPDLYYQYDSDDAFIREVWNFVAQLTTYSSEFEETPRFPLETLLAGGGDCEDTAILFASLLDAVPSDWEIDVVYMDADHPTQPQGSNHVIVRVSTGSRRYLVETTSKSEMEPFYEGIRGWFFDIDG